MRFPSKIGLPGSNRRLLDSMRNGLIRDVVAGSWWWCQRLRLRDFTRAAATSQVITFATLFPNNPFPEHVIRKNALMYVELPLVGPSISNGTALLGDAGDPNGLIELAQGSIFTAGMRQDVAAAVEYDPRYEAAFSPQVTLASTGANLSVATQLELKFMIEFSPALYV
jgi:hypothetical protein